MSEAVKEYVNREGVSEVKVRYLDGVVEIEDKDETVVKVTNEQARWLATELDENFGGGKTHKILEDRVLFFAGQVNEATVLDAQKNLIKLAEKWTNRAAGERGHITLFINTPGGACYHGLALVDTIRHLRGMGIPVVGIVQGMAFSMGSVLLQACSKRLIAKHGRLMVHEVSSVAWGKVHEIQDDLKEAKAIQNIIAGIYAERNTAGKNDPKFWVRYITGKDKFLTGEECVKLGLADEIFDPITNISIDVKP